MTKEEVIRRKKLNPKVILDAFPLTQLWCLATENNTLYGTILMTWENLDSWKPFVNTINTASTNTHNVRRIADVTSIIKLFFKIFRLYSVGQCGRDNTILDSECCLCRRTGFWPSAAAPLCFFPLRISLMCCTMRSIATKTRLRDNFVSNGLLLKSQFKNKHYNIST